MAAPKLRTPADATISAPALPDDLRLSTERFRADCRAREAAYRLAEADRAVAMAEHGPSPAFAAAEAAMAEHAGRWAQARRDALAGTDLIPARDRSPNLKGFLA
ncbi:hypothetical protein FV232_01060 [Methylobacterium sp. WL30]|uniref:hypothetical protein n=2 Tax=Methylobacterium TaxID=407 RepID=UPI0011CBEE50|nr:MULTISPECIES: hypothetical protein [unclassified Methylobacterium]TXN52245.1 hypothetical protein FV227_04110 [Methylobacterium sp. WL119]TXN70672.1 hypothetical protein FV232_01060 [Methylobacterium sp. WL30]